MSGRTSISVLSATLKEPLSQTDVQGVMEYRRRLYVNLWERSKEDGLLDIFSKPTTQGEAEKIFSIEASGKKIFTNLLRILCKVGALNTYFDSEGRRVYVQTNFGFVSLPKMGLDEEAASATGQMTIYQASQIPHVTFRALREPQVRVQFSEPFEKWWRAVLEAKFYATGRDMSSFEVGAPGTTVVDLGSGLGHGLRTLSANVGPYGKVIGVEMSPYHLDVSRKVAGELGNVEIVEADLNDGLPFIPTGSVSGAMITGAFHFILRKEFLLSEVSRISKNDSRFVIGNCFMDIDVFDREYLDLFFSLIKPISRPIAPDVLSLLLRAHGYDLYFDYLVGAFGWYFAQKHT